MVRSPSRTDRLKCLILQVTLRTTLRDHSGDHSEHDNYAIIMRLPDPRVMHGCQWRYLPQAVSEVTASKRANTYFV
jgi:hypothetical protein